MSSATTLPQDSVLEKTLLGLCLESQDNYDRMAQVLQGDASKVFFAPNHQRAMTAIQTLLREGRATDLAGMKIELTKLKAWHDNSEEEVLGYFDASIANRGYSQGVEGIAMHLAGLSLKRMTIAVCNDFLSRAYDGSTDGFEIAQALSDASSQLDGPITKHNIKHVGDLIQPFFDKLESNQKILQSGERSIIGQSSGLTVFDEFTGGDQPGDLHIIAARPGEGKSVLALEMAKGGAMAGDGQAILSLEMDDDMQIARLISDMSNVYNHKIQRATVDAIDWERLIRTADAIKKLPIFLEFCPGLTILQLEPRIRWLVRTKGVKRVFIDYLQLMDSDNATKSEIQNENLRIGKITKRLKQLAGKLGIAIVLLSQMSRDIEKRPGEKIPILSDLRDSGSLEQDANNVTFLYSPSRYDKTIPNYLLKFYPKVDSHDMQRLTFLVRSKSRNGAIGMVPVWNDRQYCRMSTITERHIYHELGMLDLVPPHLAVKFGWEVGVQQELFASMDKNNQSQNTGGSNGDDFPF
jgi:replicative DNA helicase